MSTAPDALRTLPPVEQPAKPVKAPKAVKPKPVKPPKPKADRVPTGQQNAPCGTYTALRRHRRRGEDCAECAGAKAWGTYDRERYLRLREKQGLSTRKLQPCGTDGAYRRHMKQGTPVCDPCRAAHNAANRRLDARKAAS